jgi:hypothetical protein
MRSVGIKRGHERHAPERVHLQWLSQGARIVEKDSGNVTSMKQFVWIRRDTEPAEEGDGSNAVTRRFYAQGEQMGGASYYYTMDHLGAIREMSDGSGTIHARTGPFGNGALPNGLYAADNYRDRGPGSGDYNRRMTIDGFGFSYDLTPGFPTDRTLLRIHPDGGRPGSEGCIALRAHRKQLQDFATRVNAYLRAYGMIPVLVNQ